jgi:hypothetical protein
MRKKNFYIFFFFFTLTGYAWLVWNIFEYTNRPAICMFRELTHLPCPSCGTTRAVMLLLSGHFLESAMVNPLGLLLAAAMIVIPIWMLADFLRKDSSLFRTYIRAEELFKKKLWLALPAISLIVINWIWNISKGI